MEKIRVEVCFGTTCHIMGSSELLELEDELPTNVAKHTEIVGVNCLDYCMDRNFGKAPFIRIDGEVYSEMTKEKLSIILQEKVKSL